MQEKLLFEYAVIRVVPRVEREEFMNVGVILYCKKLQLLQCRYQLDLIKITLFAPALNVEEFKEHLQSFEQICMGTNVNSPIALLDTASRFRWLTATRSTVLQTGKVHPGTCTTTEGVLEKLFTQFAL